MNAHQTSSSKHRLGLLLSLVLVAIGSSVRAQVAADSNTPPSITKLSPVDGSYTFGSRHNVLVATFDRPVAINKGGRIEIRDLTDGSANEVITLPDSRVTFGKANDLHIDLGKQIELGTHYSIRISKDALVDAERKSVGFPGIFDDTTWDFSTVKELHNVLVVTIEIKDDKPNRDIKQALGELFEKPVNVDEAFRVASYGKLGLVLGDDSDMDPTVELKWPHLGPDDHRKKNFRHRAQEELIKKGYKLENYRFVCYIMPRSIPGPAGSASVGGRWSNYKVFWFGTIIHEMGHCLGAQHSVGDPGCVMGVWYNNFNAPVKDHLGWLKPFPDTITKVTADTSLALVPLNKHPSIVPGMRIVNVPVAKGRSLCISYRVHEKPYSELKKPDDNSKRVHVSFLPPDGRSRSHHLASLAAGETAEYDGVEVTCKKVAEDGLSAEVTIRFPGAEQPATGQ